jgi:flagellar basal-body rod protein FlgF
VDAQGNLVNQTGYQLVGTNGPINVPADHRLSFENDGTVTAIPLDGQTNVVPLGKLKLVDIPTNQVQRRDDGLFTTRTGEEPQISNDVRIVEGYVETSNVNPIDMMVQMISAARQFDVNMKLISKTDENARATNSLLGMS